MAGRSDVEWVERERASARPGEQQLAAHSGACSPDRWPQMEAGVADKVGVSRKFVTFKRIDVTALDSFKVTCTIMPPGKDGKMDVWDVMEKIQKADPTSENTLTQV